MPVKIVEKYTEKYAALTDQERQKELGKVKKFEDIVSVLSLILIIGSRYSEHGAVNWLFKTFSLSGIKIEYMLFPLMIIVEVAYARTSKSVMPLIVMFMTAFMATVITYGEFFYFMIYSAVFAFAEIRLIAMKMLPGYPLFHEGSKTGVQPLPIYDLPKTEDTEEQAAESIYSYDAPYDESQGFDMKELIIPDDLRQEGTDDTKEDR